MRPIGSGYRNALSSLPLFSKLEDFPGRWKSAPHFSRSVPRQTIINLFSPPPTVYSSPFLSPKLTQASSTKFLPTKISLFFREMFVLELRHLN